MNFGLSQFYLSLDQILRVIFNQTVLLNNVIFIHVATGYQHFLLSKGDRGILGVKLDVILTDPGAGTPFIDRTIDSAGIKLLVIF